MDEYDIYIRRFRAGGPERPELALRRVFGLDAEQAREFVASLPRVVKRRVPECERGRYERVLGDMGAELEFRRSPIQPAQVVAVKGAASAQLSVPSREPGHVLTLGEPLAAADTRATRIDPDTAALTPAPSPGPAPPAPAASVHPVAVVRSADESAHSPHELGTAQTQRMEAVHVSPTTTRLESKPPPAPAEPAAAQPLATPAARAWTLANTPAVQVSSGEGFAGLPVRGPATLTLRQQPAFGAAGTAPTGDGGPHAVGGSPAAASPPAPRPTPTPEAPHAGGGAAAWGEAASEHGPCPTPAEPASPGHAAHDAPSLASAYSAKSASDSARPQPLQLSKQPSWLVSDASMKQQRPGESPPAAGLSLELDEPAGRSSGAEPAGTLEQRLAQAFEAEAVGAGEPGAWFSSLRNEAGSAPVRGRPVSSRRPPAGAAQRAGAVRPPGVAAAGGLAAGVPVRPAHARPAVGAPGRGRAARPGGRGLLTGAGLGLALILLWLGARHLLRQQADADGELSTDSAQAVDGTDEVEAIQARQARTWLEPGNHQFRDPSTGEVLVDKDPVRALVQRLHRLGASEVYVYGVHTADLLVYAEGLDVVLPFDPSQRGAIFLEEARFHRRDTPSVPDTGQARLRIAVP